MSLTPKNWASFQHYKDRAPLWIKLHRGLLDNVDYFRLSGDAGKSLPLIWLLASEKDGAVPDAPEVAFRLRIDQDRAEKILAELTERGFLMHAEHIATPAQNEGTLAQRTAAANGFGSRHISDVTKRFVWERDGGKCRKCGSSENVEYDHVHPVSKGGSSEKENIQLLCRPCNRSKRTSIATPAEHFDTPKLGSRSLEKRREENITKTDSRSIEADQPCEQIDLEEAMAAKKTRDPSRFDDFWQAFPRRDGPNPRKPAEIKFNTLVKSGCDPKIMIDAVKKLASDETARGNIGTRFIPQAVTWLNQQRWSDHAAVAFLVQDAELPIETAVKMWAKMRHWSRHAGGPAPGEPGCRASVELLAKYGLGADGLKIEPDIPAIP